MPGVSFRVYVGGRVWRGPAATATRLEQKLQTSILQPIYFLFLALHLKTAYTRNPPKIETFIESLLGRSESSQVVLSRSSEADLVVLRPAASRLQTYRITRTRSGFRV